MTETISFSFGSMVNWISLLVSTPFLDQRQIERQLHLHHYNYNEKRVIVSSVWLQRAQKKQICSITYLRPVEKISRKHKVPTVESWEPNTAVAGLYIGIKVS